MFLLLNLDLYSFGKSFNLRLLAVGVYTFAMDSLGVLSYFCSLNGDAKVHDVPFISGGCSLLRRTICQKTVQTITSHTESTKSKVYLSDIIISQMIKLTHKSHDQTTSLVHIEKKN